MDDFGGFVVVILGIMAVVFVVYCIILIASALAGIAGIGGIAWGSGTAIINYGKSFQENMIDSNKVAA